MKQGLRMWSIYALIGVLGYLYACEGIVGDTSGLIFAVPDPKRNAYGFIDYNGIEVIPYTYSYAFDFSEGLAAVNIGGSYHSSKIPMDGKWGFINVNGEFEINPQFDSPPFSSAWIFSPSDVGLILHHGYQFHESLAAIWEVDRWIYINPNGLKVIGNASGNPILSARKFSEGRAAVLIDQLWGYIDTVGNLMIPPAYLFPSEFKDGYAYVVDEELNRYLIDKHGEPYMLPFRLADNFYDGIAPYKEPFEPLAENTVIEEELKYGLIDTLARKKVKPSFDRIGEHHDNYVPVLVGSRPSDLLSFPDDRIEASAFKGGKWGYINLEGDFVILPLFDEAKGFYHDLAAVRNEDLWGYIDKQGDIVINYQFSWAGNFEEEIAIVRLSAPQRIFDQRYAYINTDGEIIYIFPR